MGKLQDLVAVVTGSGQGLGFEMAHAFADEGAKLVLTGLDQGQLEAKAEILRTQGAEVLAVAGDVRIRHTAQNTVERTLAAFGRLDILVNNAQWLSLPVPFIEQDDEHIEQMVRSGLFGTIYFMQAAYAPLRKRGGAVINLGSGQGVIGGIGAASYAATKEAIRGLSRVAAREWGKDQIRVNVICPAATSQSFKDWFKDKPEELARTTEQAALRRFADPYKDMGRLAVYLADPHCFLTGQTIHLDGGQCMP
jgi:NAD(P)-dependent dehydrogenase (short-subunit alcohol dehydrogenase family)